MRKSWEERKRRRLERIISEFEIVNGKEVRYAMRDRYFIQGVPNFIARDPISGSYYRFFVMDGLLTPYRTWYDREVRSWEMPAFELLFLGLY